MLDMNSDAEGNVNEKMISYSSDINRKLIEDSYNSIDFLKDISTETKDKTAKYPEILKCSDKSQSDGIQNQGTGKKSPADYLLSPFAIALGFLILSVVVLVKFKYKKKQN